jgi:hypothetical protein
MTKYSCCPRLICKALSHMLNVLHIMKNCAPQCARLWINLVMQRSKMCGYLQTE